MLLKTPVLTGGSRCVMNMAAVTVTLSWMTMVMTDGGVPGLTVLDGEVTMR